MLPFSFYMYLDTTELDWRQRECSNNIFGTIMTMTE